MLPDPLARALRALTAYWNPTFQNSRSATPVHLYAIHSPFDYILRAEIERRELKAIIDEHGCTYVHGFLTFIG